MRHFFLWAAVAFGGLAWADDPKPTEADQKEARRLVKQLGSRDATERVRAERRLIDLGPAAVDAVKDGRTSSSEQVAERCERLIVRFREVGLDRPAWREFEKVCGDSDAAKQAYRWMAKESDLSYWLEKIEDDPAAAEGAYQEALDALVKWHSKLPERQRGGQPYPLYQAVFFLFAGGMDAAAKVKVPKGEAPAKEFQAALWAVVQAVVQRPGVTDTKVEERLLAHWMAAQGREDTKLAVLFALARYRVPDTLAPPLKAWASDKSAVPAVRVRSLGLAAAAGADVTAAAETLLWVKDEYANDPRPGRTAQTRDVAAVCLIRARGYLPEDFGFAGVRSDDRMRKEEEKYYEWGVNTNLTARYGFTDDAARERAHATLKAFLALKPMPPLGKAVPPREDPPELLAQIAQVEADARAAEVPSSETVLKRVYALTDDYPTRYQRIAYEATRIVLDTGPTSAAAFTDALRRFNDSRPDPLNRVSILRRLADRELNGNGKFALNRANATDHLLSAYAELLKLELPEKRQDMPTALRLGADATARERAEYIMTGTARREAEYVCDLLDARDAVVAQLIDLYKPDPKKPGRDDDGPEELKGRAEKKLPKAAVEGLMKQIR